MSYYVRCFRLFELKSSSVFYGATSATILKDDRLKGVLSELLSYGEKLIHQESLTEIIQRFGLEIEKTLAYLVKHLKLLIPAERPHVTIERVCLRSTNAFFEELLREELHGTLPVPIQKLDQTQQEIGCHRLVLDFSDAFTPNHIKDLYASCHDAPQTSFLTSYVLHRSFVVDGLFSPSKGTPCHFFLLRQWEHLEKGRRQISEASWYNYFHYVSSQDADISLSLPITKAEIGLLITVLKKKLRWLITGEVLPAPFDPRAFTRCNLDDGTMDSDLIPHWPGCGCISGCWS